MKNFLTTILTILYMASALSLTVHVHYCMGKFAGVSFIQNNEDRCGKCGMNKADRSKDCCKDQHKLFKAADHKLAQASFDFSQKQIAIAPQPVYCSYTEPVIFHTTGKTNLANAPPSRWRTCPIYILIQDYRI